MSRAVLDSSVLVSAFISPQGAVASIIRTLLAKPIELCVSDAILNETCHTLLTKSRLRRYATYDDSDVEAWMNWLMHTATVVEPAPGIANICRDPLDDIIIATAVGAQARLLITGDDDLLCLDPYHDIRIVTPRQCLELLVNE